jgi:two-component system NtrC family sensor kinase
MVRHSRTGGRASKAKARRASHAKGRKTAKTSPNDKRRRNAGRETEVARLKRELKEALAWQTATSEILHVISQSPTDVRPVFDAIVLTAMRLFRCDLSFVMLCDHTNFWVAAAATPEGLFDDLTLVKEPIDPSANFPSRAIVEKQLLYLPDWSLIDLPEHERQIHERTGLNSALYLPMLREGECIGLLTVGGKRPGSFGESEIALTESFRDQALIAIENTRLFNETREALEKQTATADILRVISESPTDVQPVFDAIVASLLQLFGTQFAAVQLLRDGSVTMPAVGGKPGFERLAQRYPRPLDETTVGGRAILSKQTLQFLALDDPATPAGTQEFARDFGYNSVLFTPLIHEEKVIGSIGTAHPDAKVFDSRQIALIETFARQAVIAISNVRLFEQVQARTRELSVSLDDLRTAQDRLVQTEKLASLGQLTAGIAHEIKNPLNFVNNFSALSAELIDELAETLAPAPLDQKMRGDVGELTAMLKSNLEKVVQHGKRADSIVKNMLLHSREGFGEHRSADINALVEESLNLAYHGARAEKSAFNITLKRDLDPDAGAVELYPQEITRALLNLISNGFYAATQRKSEEGETFEPVLIAATKNLGKTVEIRIRDNGAGIPSDVREKIFNPFFTTKPSGEGTGLGLSMSHDIIVKQHGGSIDVETSLGLFTEFKILLPRTNQG